MHVIIVGRGDDPRSSAAVAAFRYREDVTLGRVSDASTASEIVDAHAGEACLAILLANGTEDIVFSDLPVLTSRSIPTLILAATDSRELRATAFRAGASEVIFPPHDPLRLEAACMVLLKGHLRTEPRCSIPIPAIIRTQEGSEFRATLLNLSRGGFRAEVAGVLVPGAIVHVALSPPDPWKMPTLFARILAGRDPEFGKQDIRAQWVGLASDEMLLLGELVESLAPDTTEVLGSLDQLLAMSVATLRDQKFVAGIRVPPLTTYERLGVAAAEGDAILPLGVVALVRCRACMVAVLLDTTTDPKVGDAARRLPIDAWRTEFKAAQEIVRNALAARMTEAKPAPIREMRDLQARLSTASDQMERVFADATGGRYEKRSAALLQEKNAIGTFEKRIEETPQVRSDVPPPRRFRRPRLVALIAIAVPLLASAVWAQFLMRVETVPPSESIELAVPKFREGKIGIRSVIDDREAKTRYVVVDAGWYKSTDREHELAVWDMMKVLNLPPDWKIGIRNLAGVYLTSCRWPGPENSPAPRTTAQPTVSVPLPPSSPTPFSSR